MANGTAIEPKIDQMGVYSSSVTLQHPQLVQGKTRVKKSSLQAGTLGYITQYMLMATPRQLQIANINSGVLMDEETNNVVNIIHVIFASYRLFATPLTLFTEIIHHYNAIDPKPPHLKKQLNFLFHYWLTKYPEDFAFVVSEEKDTQNDPSLSNECIPSSSNEEVSSSVDHGCDIQHESSPVAIPCRTEMSFMSHRIDPEAYSAGQLIQSVDLETENWSGSSPCFNSNDHKSPGERLVNVLLRTEVDLAVYQKALFLHQQLKESDFCSSRVSFSTTINLGNGSPEKLASVTNIIEVCPRLVAAHLTTIDLENFLAIKPYHLLEGTKSNLLVRNTIKYFNLLSLRVVNSILKSSSPNLAAAHWIKIAFHLHRMNNFNSLKAVICGLANHSIYRLNNVIWSKMDKKIRSEFKFLSSIVDEERNQALLRQAQLRVTKLRHNSFGPIPYLGTFFTDLTIIDSKYSSTIRSESGEKLINLEKCCKQFQVITQVQLLQKNVQASFYAHKFAQSLKSKPNLIVPEQSSRVFRQWFYEQSDDILTENQCYQLSLGLEPPTPKNGRAK